MNTRCRLVALTVLALLGTAHALYEDQAGTYDWYRAHVGHVAGASFHKSKPRLYVSTEQGVLGALNLRDGSIAFRHRLSEAGGTTTSVLLDNPALLISLTEGSLDAWEPTDGLHKWGTALNQSAACLHRPALAVIPGDSPQIVVLAQGTLQMFDSTTGNHHLSVTLSEEAAAQTQAVVHADGGKAVAYTFTPGQSSVYATALEEGGASQALSSSQPLSEVVAAGPAGFAALSQDFRQLCTAGPGASSIQCHSLSELGAKAITGKGTAQVVATATGWALASGDAAAPGAVLLKAAEDGSSSQVASFPSASAVSFAQAMTNGEQVAFIDVEAGTGAVSIQYVATSSGSTTSREGPIQGARSESLAPGVTSPSVRAAYLGSYKKRDQSEGCRVLLVWSDERVTFTQQGVSVWGRDEALGGVQAALFSDLPPAKHAAAAGGAVNTSQFLHLQLLGAKVQFKLASADEVTEYTQLRTSLSDKLLPNRDSRGFRRCLIVATASGKVAALHNGDGHTIWSRPGPAGRRGTPAATQHLLQWRTYHDLQNAPQVALLSDQGQGQAQLSVLDAYTGAELQQTTLPYRIDKLVPIGLVNDGEHAQQLVYLAVQAGLGGAAPSVHLLPDTPLTRSHFGSHYRSLYFFLDTSAQPEAATGQAPAFRGFGFGADAVEAINAGRAATALPAWSLALPEPVLTWAVPDPNEPVHTSVKVLGDRSMKYRYLNPNSLVVVTGTPAGSPAADGPDLQTATIYIIDTVTGAVRHHQAQPGCRGPATALMTENLVLVQLWDAASARFMMVPLELYDATERQFSVLDHMFNPNATQPQSSFAPPPLEVLTSSFYTRVPAKQLLATRTRAGITSKMLIILSHTDQVYTLDMRFLDPRRPRHAKLTPQEQEERLLPYQDTLPLMPNGYASYNKQVLGLKGAVSAASRLESTSLLFAYGVDLQYTRLAPAKGFDSLDDDFSYALLIVALVALSAASVFMHVFTKKSMLKAKWQ